MIGYIDYMQEGAINKNLLRKKDDRQMPVTKSTNCNLTE
jgi:hypothetical protein